MFQHVYATWNVGHDIIGRAGCQAADNPLR
jgi:hypothetical protein